MDPVRCHFVREPQPCGCVVIAGERDDSCPRGAKHSKTCGLVGDCGPGLRFLMERDEVRYADFSSSRVGSTPSSSVITKRDMIGYSPGAVDRGRKHAAGINCRGVINYFKYSAPSKTDICSGRAV